MGEVIGPLPYMGPTTCAKCGWGFSRPCECNKAPEQSTVIPDAKLRVLAAEQFCVEGELDIDADARIIRIDIDESCSKADCCEEKGAWVQAWVWVSLEED